MTLESKKKKKTKQKQKKNYPRHTENNAKFTQFYAGSKSITYDIL